MAPVRCPVLVGRQAEAATVRTAVAAARAGRGRTVAVLGEPGIGKSRLVRDTAADVRRDGLPVLVGRGVETGTGTAFRALGEALLAGLRHRPVPDDPELRPFLPVLGRLVPRWRTGTAPPEVPLVVLGEAVLRLLAALAGRDGLVLVLEDVHWSDPDSLTVLEYLADNVAEEPVSVLVTARDEPGPARSLVRALEGRHACTVVQLAPLGPDGIGVMAAACLGVPDADSVPPGMLAALRRRCGGIPLLLEELVGTDADAAVPAGLVDLVAARLGSLPAARGEQVRAAAVLGQVVSADLLAHMVGADERTVVEDLRAAVAAGLLEDGGPTGFRFRHALARDAVLAVSSPSERAGWARAGLAAVAALHPDVDGPWCDLAADLAVTGGEAAAAAALLCEAGRRNLGRGALGSAEAALRRARALAGEDASQCTAVDEALAEVLARAGRAEEATTVSERLIEQRRGSPDRAALAAAHLRLARVHTRAGTWHAARRHLGVARAEGADGPLLTCVAAQVELGAGRFGEARELAEEALAGADEVGEVGVACEALLVLGRLARRHDLAAAEALFERALHRADTAWLPIEAGRAGFELAINDVQESLRVDRLHAARRQAEALGDLAAVAGLDLQEAATRNARWEPEQARVAAARSVAAARRYGLPTLPKALVLGAAADTYLGRHEEAEAAMAEALAHAPDDAHLLGEAHGVRAYRALDRADDTRAREHLARAMSAFTRRPSEVTGSPVVGLWVLLAGADDPPGRSRVPLVNRWNRGLARFADAVTAGRTGDAAGAVAAFHDADAILRDPADATWFRLQGRRVAAAAALADGWGDPVRWLRADLPVIEARGTARWAGAVRGLLGRAGAPVPRPADGSVPGPLQVLGVTARETDVLRLVAEGRTNREIAGRLYLSPRTVEKHVERLLHKTGHARRAELVAAAGQLLTDRRG